MPMTMTFWAKIKIPRNNVKKNSDSYIREKWCRNNGRKGFWWGNLRERNHLEGLGVDGKKILRWIFSKWDVGAWTNWIDLLRIGTDSGNL